MRHAFTLLGIMTLIVFVGAIIAFERAEAPTVTEETIQESNNAMTLTLTSPAFQEGGLIPQKFSCDGEGISPELNIAGIPEETKSLVLVMDDSDIPESVKQSRGIEKFDHWVLYNLSSDTNIIPEGEKMGSEGINSTGEPGYVAPCPPDKEHRYIFRLYAISGTLHFSKAPTLDEVEEAARSMTLNQATLTGRYERIQH